ncbi:hypothetical protein SS50377_24314 [Spironucleus salmonicida]|uniref:Uncharacterized protein n=1 Tax=Spironucleus salmonicida TaxID=348837 RepID=V6LPG5_9EUKA|nr:hypothetical protein SS50377_24308 [Spironucleus salmonicida]KAH0574359.1 hypothetical protein SS50377_24314 [Spironucleus salmonicida]|eukprot:EST46133.1 Hypothetical protein SS50377_14130 [Spironucleus salmonicida]
MKYTIRFSLSNILVINVRDLASKIVQYLSTEFNIKRDFFIFPVDLEEIKIEIERLYVFVIKRPITQLHKSISSMLVRTSSKISISDYIRKFKLNGHAKYTLPVSVHIPIYVPLLPLQEQRVYAAGWLGNTMHPPYIPEDILAQAKRSYRPCAWRIPEALALYELKFLLPGSVVFIRLSA